MSEEMRNFWNERLSENKTLVATGHRAFNLAYNQALYEVQQRTLDTILQTNQVNPANKRVLDVGSGLGFFVNYFLTNGAKEVVGLDIAPTSVAYLQQTYPECQFHCVDIGSVQTLPVTSQFDIVSVVSVLYHLIEDESFWQALNNICQVIVPGGYLLVSDTFKPTWQLTASHVRFRTLDMYQPIFEQFELQVIDIVSMYYLMNRTFIPYVLPPILSLKPLTQLLVNIDRRLRRRGIQFGAGLKMLLAKRGTP